LIPELLYVKNKMTVRFGQWRLCDVQNFTAVVRRFFADREYPARGSVNRGRRSQAGGRTDSHRDGAIGAREAFGARPETRKHSDRRARCGHDLAKR
jgi:hypothetical protein